MSFNYGFHHGLKLKLIYVRSFSYRYEPVKFIRIYFKIIKFEDNLSGLQALFCLLGYAEGDI